MKTEKKSSKSYAKLIEYVPIWTYHILNNDEGYSISRAYEINPLFGQLVERSVFLSKINNDTIAMLRRNNQDIMAKALIDYQKSRNRLLNTVGKYSKGKADDSEVAEAHNDWFNNLFRTMFINSNNREMNDDEMNQMNKLLEEWDKIKISDEMQSFLTGWVKDMINKANGDK